MSRWAARKACLQRPYHQRGENKKKRKKRKEMGGKLRYGKNKAAAFKSLSRAVGRDEGRPACEHH